MARSGGAVVIFWLARVIFLQFLFQSAGASLLTTLDGVWGREEFLGYLEEWENVDYVFTIFYVDFFSKRDPVLVNDMTTQILQSYDLFGL